VGNVEIWYRGEGAGVSPAKPGGHLHDFGDGVYFTNEERVARTYAQRRAPNNPANQRVWMVALDRATLGRVLDLTLDARWQQFMNRKESMLLGKSRLEYLKTQHELYDQFFKEFLRLHKINIGSYDVVIGPEYNLGGKQLCILHKNGQPAKLAARVRALFRPVTAVVRWTVSTAIGMPVDVQVAPPPGSLKIRFVKVVGGSILAAGLMLVVGYWLGKKTQEQQQKIINKKIKSFESEVERTVSANKGYIVHSAASGKRVYAVVSVTVYYMVTADTAGFGPSPPTQSIPDVQLDKVVMGTEKIEGPGKEYDRGRPPVTTYYQPYTFSVEVTAPEEEVERYKAAMREYQWYEETLKNSNLIKADIERLTKEKELLKELIQKSFY
jgi:hypothetical protein